MGESENSIEYVVCSGKNTENKIQDKKTSCQFTVISFQFKEIQDNTICRLTNLSFEHRLKMRNAKCKMRVQ
ncbi:hypothetical protein ES708_16940 [subsurface metagenome]